MSAHSPDAEPRGRASLPLLSRRKQTSEHARCNEQDSPGTLQPDPRVTEHREAASDRLQPACKLQLAQRSEARWDPNPRQRGVGRQSQGQGQKDGSATRQHDGKRRDRVALGGCGRHTSAALCEPRTATPCFQPQHPVRPPTLTHHLPFPYHSV